MLSVTVKHDGLVHAFLLSECETNNSNSSAAPVTRAAFSVEHRAQQLPDEPTADVASFHPSYQLETSLLEIPVRRELHPLAMPQHRELRLAQGLQLGQLFLPQVGVELLHERAGGRVVDTPQAGRQSAGTRR